MLTAGRQNIITQDGQIEKINFRESTGRAKKINFAGSCLLAISKTIALLVMLTMSVNLHASDPTTIIEAADTILIITNPEAPIPDDIYAGEEDEIIIGSINQELHQAGDHSHTVSLAQWVAPAATFAVASLFVRTPPLVQAREYVQKHLSQHGLHKTEVDNYLQYLPMVAGYGLDFLGVRSQHRFIDRTLLLAVSYATFGVVNIAAKSAFREKRPDSNAHNSFPSGHTGTAFVGAEFMRREYWQHSKWLAMSGYVVAVGIGYMRIHNDRHWINDVVGGAALGYLSTTFAYWLYPRLFKHRAILHRNTLLQSPKPRHTPALTLLGTPYITAGGAGLNATLIF